jgi:DNA-binding PadR family transcriptional regulator
MSQPNRTQQALLGFLSWGAMSGYDLSQMIAGSISNFWSESPGRIYPILARLVDEGLATRAETVSDGGRLRHVYAITERGRAVFEAWLHEPVKPRPHRNELLLKLFFGARTDPEASLRLVETFRTQLAGKLEHYAEIRQRLESVKDAPPDRAYWLMTLRYGELEARAQLDWCDEIVRASRAERNEHGESSK